MDACVKCKEKWDLSSDDEGDLLQRLRDSGDISDDEDAAPNLSASIMGLRQNLFHDFTVIQTLRSAAAGDKSAITKPICVLCNNRLQQEVLKRTKHLETVRRAFVAAAREHAEETKSPVAVAKPIKQTRAAESGPATSREGASTEGEGEAASPRSSSFMLAPPKPSRTAVMSLQLHQRAMEYVQQLRRELQEARQLRAKLVATVRHSEELLHELQHSDPVTDVYSIEVPAIAAASATRDAEGGGWVVPAVPSRRGFAASTILTAPGVSRGWKHKAKGMRASLQSELRLGTINGLALGHIDGAARPSWSELSYALCHVVQLVLALAHRLDLSFSQVKISVSGGTAQFISSKAGEGRAVYALLCDSRTDRDAARTAQFRGAVAVLLQCVEALYARVQQLADAPDAPHLDVVPAEPISAATCSVGGHSMGLQLEAGESLPEAWSHWNQAAIGLLRDLSQLVHLSASAQTWQ